MQNQFDRIILVQCTLENQRQRMKERNHWTDLEIDQRLKNQIPLKDKASLADIVIENDGSLADLKSKIKELIDNGFTIQKKILD
ncbi:MAG: dephospho-CoA kinase [Bdellovibrionales bacterium]|nr:dephospho-CoA kinase [Bdellovibrionales bacterium]